MKIKNKIFTIDPILHSNWREKDRNSDTEDRLAKRFVESVQSISGSKKERQFIYNRFGSVICVNIDEEK